jgi:fibro-slime domain-containing protein
MRFHLLVGSVLLLFIVAPVKLQAQLQICDTNHAPWHIKRYKVPVTYFDFHEDGSNADFGFRVTARWDQQKLDYLNYSGWADSTLTADKSPKRFPALTDTFFSISWNLAKLFKPWTQGVMDTFVWKTPPIITYVDSVDSAGYTVFDSLGNAVRLDTITTLIPDTIMISDTMFKNIAIPDSLMFSWVINDFALENPAESLWMAGSAFKYYPINGKGFVDENLTGDNTGYTMSLHNKFTYHGGEKLYVGADDDAYVFINGKLVIEEGGFHEAIIMPLEIDSLHLTVGQKYDIDIFYVERRLGGGIQIYGILDFEDKGSSVDRVFDSVTINCVGVMPRSEKSRYQKGTVLGLRVPPSSQKVKIEYFTASGVKLAAREMPLARALVNQSVGLPQGMYLVRVTFLNAQGKRVFTESLRKMIVRK